MLDNPTSQLLWARLPCWFLILGLVPLVRAQWPSRQLENFFPAWDGYLNGIIATDCASSFEADRQTRKEVLYNTVECLLKALPEYRKSEMGASSVALGLLPPILSLLGPSITDRALLASRRPLLSLLLTACSPAVNPLLGDEYTDSIEKKLSPESAIDEESHNTKLSRSDLLMSLFEHVVAVGALLNVVILAYQLSIFTITSFSVIFAYLPVIWVVVSIPIHLASYLSLRLRARVRKPKKRGAQGRRNGLISSFADSFVAEFTPCIHQPPKTLEWCGEGELRQKAGRVLAWLLNFGIVVDMFFGTLTLSGLLFISARDSIGIVARFVASTLVAQWIFAYELAGIKKTTFLVNSGSTPKSGVTGGLDNTLAN